jgi:hypothetical protein
MPTAAVGMFSANSHAHASVSMAPNNFFNRLLGIGVPTAENPVGHANPTILIYGWQILTAAGSVVERFHARSRAFPPKAVFGPCFSTGSMTDFPCVFNSLPVRRRRRRTGGELAR